MEVLVKFLLVNKQDNSQEKIDPARFRVKGKTQRGMTLSTESGIKSAQNQAQEAF